MMKTPSSKINWFARLVYGLIAIVAFSLISGRETTLASQATAPSEEITVSQNGLTIEWSAGEIDWQAAEDGTFPHIDGFETSSQPGVHQLPFRTVPFAIPADTEIEFKVNTATAIQLKSASKLAISPKPAGVLRDSKNNVIGGDFEAAALDITHQLKTVEVEEIGTMRGIRLGRAVFHPITVEDGTLQFVSSASVQISFHSMRAVPSLTPPLADGPMADILGQEIVNPEHLIPNKAAMPQKRFMQGPESAAAVIDVSGEGMVHVSHQDLVDWGIDPTQLDPTTLQLLHAGSSLALQWMGDADAQFESGEAFRFYAPSSNSRWSNTGRFLLKNGETARKNIGSRSGVSNEPPAVLQKREMIEQNNVY